MYPVRARILIGYPAGVFLGVFGLLVLFPGWTARFYDTGVNNSSGPRLDSQSLELSDKCFPQLG